MTDGGQLENVEFFKGKRVLVTGHTGYKGAWLAAVLNFMGADAAGYALAPEPGCMYEKICGDGLIHSMTGDLLDSSLLERTVEEIQPEIVIHLAGFGRRQDCLSEPVRTFQTNLMGSTVLLEALRKCTSVKSIVLESSYRLLEESSCQSFQESSYRPLEESSCQQFEESARALRGRSIGIDCGGKASFRGVSFRGADLYAGSKACMEYMARDYCRRYFQTDSRMTGVAAVRVGSDPSGGGHMQAGVVWPASNYTVEKTADGIYRLSVSACREPVLEILDSYLTVSRLLYENPAAYAGEWDIVPGQGSSPGGACEKAGGQPEGFSRCRIDGETEREICMRVISEYYRKR